MQACRNVDNQKRKQHRMRVAIEQLDRRAETKAK